jgi:hypothetical protein
MARPSTRGASRGPCAASSLGTFSLGKMARLNKARIAAEAVERVTHNSPFVALLKQHS